MVLFLMMTSLCFATIVNDGGVAYTPVTKTHSAVVGAETDRTVWTPASGNKIVLNGVMFWADTKTQAFVEQGTNKVIPNFSMDTASGITVIGNGTPIWKGGLDETLTYTTETASSHSILLWGYETTN